VGEVGRIDGWKLGPRLGTIEGIYVGDDEGVRVGEVGATVGLTDGICVGWYVGTRVGLDGRIVVGMKDGERVGVREGGGDIATAASISTSRAVGLTPMLMLFTVICRVFGYPTFPRITKP
jgi:hypothetical protein